MKTMMVPRKTCCCLLRRFLYAFIILSSHNSVIYQSDARPSVVEVSLPPSPPQRYVSVERFSDDPLPPVDPLSPDQPQSYCSSDPPFTPPSTTTLPPSPTVGSYTPSPPTPTSSSSSSYPTSSILSPPQSYSSPLTPPAATYQPDFPGVSPPPYEPTPPSSSFPSPTGFVPAPHLFEPPVVYPPPTGPPPAPHGGPSSALWCVAKPSVPDPIIQEAMNYACGSGADCESLQPNGDCFQPDTLFAHASYAFNSYWQRTKAAGGTCEFGGSAMLVTVDPSFNGCHFIYF